MVERRTTEQFYETRMNAGFRSQSLESYPQSYPLPSPATPDFVPRTRARICRKTRGTAVRLAVAGSSVLRLVFMRRAGLN